MWAAAMPALRGSRSLGGSRAERPFTIEPKRQAQFSEVAEGTEYLDEAGPGVRARRAGEVVHTDLRDRHLASAELDQRFGRQERPVGVEPQTVEHLATEDLHGAVDVSHTQAKGHRHDRVVGLGDHEPMERVAALNAPADDRVDRLPSRIIEAVEQEPQLLQVELQVAVREGDQRTRGVRETGLQRAAIAAVRLVVDAHPRVLRRQLVGELRGAVAGAVVDDEHLDRVHHRTDLLDGELHGALDVLLLVVGGEEEGELGTRGRGGRLGHEGGWLLMRSSELKRGMVGTHSVENVATM